MGIEGTTPTEVIEAMEAERRKKEAEALTEVGISAMQGIAPEATPEPDPETTNIEGLDAEHVDATTDETPPHSPPSGTGLSQTGISAMQGPKD